MSQLTVKCTCSDYYKDHLVNFISDSGELIVTTGLNHYLPFHKRFILAMSYLFGSKTPWAYVETVVSMPDAIKMKDWLEFYIEENTDAIEH